MKKVKITIRKFVYRKLLVALRKSLDKRIERTKSDIVIGYEEFRRYIDNGLIENMD